MMIIIMKFNFVVNALLSITMFCIRRLSFMNIAAIVAYVVVFFMGLHIQVFTVKSVSYIHQTPINFSHSNSPAAMSPHQYTRIRKSNELVRVLVIAYQRTGSSFLGELYNQHPDAFYWFEPIDGMYTAMYGTENGWTVPTDIYSQRNGSKRLVPDAEFDEVVRGVTAIFNCEMTDLPIEVTMHKFIQYFLKYNKDMSSHLKCFKKALKSSHPVSECRKSLGKACPSRFGANISQSDDCHKRLNGSVNVHDALGAKVDKYRDCISNKQTLGQSCMEEFQQFCSKRLIRSIKTVRLRMMHAQRLMEMIPDLRVVHVVRDPRAVVRSRVKVASYSSLYSEKDPVRESKIFCEQMAEDVKLRQQLEVTYPDRIMTVLFEDLAENSEYVGQQLFNFTGTPWHPALEKWLSKNTQSGPKARRGMTSRNSTAVIESWMGQITTKQLDEINRHCREYYELVGNIWPYTTPGVSYL